MEKIKEEIQKGKSLFESLILLQSLQKIYLTYSYEIDFNKSEVKNNLWIDGETNSELEKELFTNKIKELNSDLIRNNLNVIKEKPFDETIFCTDLKGNPIKITLNGDKINIIYVFCLYIKENDKYFGNVVKMLEENKEKWKDKIRFIALHFHDIDEKRLDWVLKKKIDFLEIYYLENGVNDSFPRRHGIGHVPAIFMIDREKKIKFKNYETNLYFKFDTGINNLIDGKNFEVNIQNQVGDEELKEEKDKIFKNIFSALDKIEEFKEESSDDLDKLVSLSMRGTYTFNYDIRKIEKDKVLLFTTFLNLEDKSYTNALLKDFKEETEEEIDEIYFECNYEIKGELIVSDNKEEKCVICQNNFNIKENNFYFCFICNIKNKNIYICENCFKNEKNCIDNAIHEHPIMFVPKNGVELIRKNKEIYCEGECRDYFNLDEDCENCDKNITDFCWQCAECKFHLCNSCFKKSLEDENFTLKQHKKEHSFYRKVKGWRIYGKPTELSTIENENMYY